jgi:molecular chaperone GrpE
MTDSHDTSASSPGQDTPLDPNSGETLSGDFESLRKSLQDAEQRYMMTLADFHNYQRRALLNEQVAKKEGAKSVASSIVNVIDHFDLALSQDTSKVSADNIVAGVRIIRDELMKALITHGIGTITPAKNDVFEPGKHAAVMQQPADGVQAGHVVMCMQSGYTFGDQVIRPAKVSVAPSAS